MILRNKIIEGNQRKGRRDGIKCRSADFEIKNDKKNYPGNL